jgi:mono/diheme cytochrome c family protein
MPRNLRLALLTALTVGVGGCEYYYNRVPSPDDLMHAVPWFDHMIGSKAVYPYQTAGIPRNAVPGTVPVGGAEGNWEAEFKSGNSATADALVNPFAGGAAGTAQAPGPSVPQLPGTVAARGDTLYHTFCAVCHGGTGDGKGPVGPRVAAPSLLTPQAQGRSDGYLYSIIRYGRGVMPRYGDKVYRPADRWAIVNYVRTLQAAAPAAVPAPATAPAAALAQPAAGGAD